MWRIYYDNGTTADSNDDINTIQTHGVICILQKQLRYNITYGAPYYALYDGEWLHFHENDLVDYLVNGIQIDKLIVGRMVTKTTFNDIFEAAKRDKDQENLQ